MKVSLPHRKEIISLLQRLIQIPCINPPGKTNKIVNFIIEEILKEEDGFTNKVIEHSKNGETLHNLISIVGNGDFKIVLSGHFDVVPTGNRTNWTDDPFSGKIKGDYIYGRGSADMKSGLTCLLSTFKTLSNIPEFLERCTMVFAGTADEEVGMTGAQKLRESRLMDDVDLLIVAEPTNLEIGIAEKGLLWVEVKIKGKPAHGSTPQKGVNAIEKTLSLIPKIHETIEKLSNPILGYSTVNIGKIKGGTAINIVPDNATLEIDYRLIPEQKVDLILTKLNALDENVEVKILKTLPALQSDSKIELISNLRKITKTDLIGLPYATDAAKLITADKKIPFIIFGPGNPEFIHNYDERVKIDDVCFATEALIKSIIKSY